MLPRLTLLERFTTAALQRYPVAMRSDNGILTKVPGEYVAQGAQSLPDPATATADTMIVALDAGWVGPVCITYRRQLAQHRKHTHWYWHAVRADAA